MKKLSEIFKEAGIVNDGVELSRRLITPEAAQMMLENNSPDNRHVRTKVVDKYARELENGNWEASNPGVITFWQDGTMVDGQHRLMAIVKSGVSVVMTVAVVPNGISFFDGQAKRDAGNYIEMKYGRKLNNQQVGAIVLYWNYVTGASASRSVTPDEIYKVYSQSSELWDAASAMTCKGPNHPLANRAFVITAAHNALEAGVDEETLGNFFKVLNSGYQNTQKDNQAVTARNDLLAWKELRYDRESNRAREGILEEYIRLYANGSVSTRRVKKPTWCYAKLIKERTKTE